MFRRNLIPMWVGIIFLASVFLLGLEACGPVGAPAPVPKTGQTTSYATGDDGDLQMGVASPSPRFTDNGNGTVTDNLTGLIWTKDANCAGGKSWNDALSYCNGLATGYCGLTDGSNAGDWRLANVNQLLSLVDYGNELLALPSGHPFVEVGLTSYWTSTTYVNGTQYAWYVPLGYGGAKYPNSKTDTNVVWCVRGGQ